MSYAFFPGIRYPKEQHGFATSSHRDDLWQNDQQASQATWLWVSKSFICGVMQFAPTWLWKRETVYLTINHGLWHFLEANDLWCSPVSQAFWTTWAGWKRGRGQGNAWLSCSPTHSSPLNNLGPPAFFHGAPMESSLRSFGKQSCYHLGGNEVGMAIRSGMPRQVDGWSNCANVSAHTVSTIQGSDDQSWAPLMMLKSEKVLFDFKGYVLYLTKHNL